MNQIEKLIEELCPNGVIHLPLEDFLTIRNGKDHKHLEDGEIPVYGSGGIMRHVNQAAASGPSVLIPRKGSLGNLFYVEGPFWVVDTIFRTEINEDIALPKFVFYELQTLGLGEMNQAGGVPSQTQSKLKILKIPIPPLPIQQEIVKILDTFQSLEAELEKRKKQYEFYRDQLLTFTERERERVRWVTLNETGSFYGGLTGKRKEDFTNGSHNFISYKQIYSNISISSEGNSRVVIHPNEHQNEVRFGDILFTGSSESREEAGFTAVVTQEFQKPTYLNSFSIGFRPSDEYAQQLNPEFTKFLFRCQSLRNQIMKAANGVTRFNVSKQRLGMIKVPIPPLEEQQRIVNILDKFDALVNDLTSGLPAEIEARRKQYEFYRDQLLTFKELSA